MPRAVAGSRLDDRFSSWKNHCRIAEVSSWCWRSELSQTGPRLHEPAVCVQGSMVLCITKKGKLFPKILDFLLSGPVVRCTLLCPEQAHRKCGSHRHLTRLAPRWLVLTGVVPGAGAQGGEACPITPRGVHLPCSPQGSAAQCSSDKTFSYWQSLLSLRPYSCLSVPMGL